jgi:fused signal recognition particle receptor
VLISSDVGVKTTLKIIDKIESRVAKDKYISSNELDSILKEEIIDIIDSSDDENQFNISKNRPHVILVVGVNGVGKTTSIGKMANHYKSLGLKVVIGAADTFRAAAIEQLEIWADRVGVDLIKQEMGSDPASVAFDTLESAINKKADVVLIDTAGRLHNKTNLMNELSKIKRVLQKKNIDAPQEVLLVIDGSTGQNAFEQAKQFTNVTEITALAVTKLDGTAKGGVVLGISDQFNIPIKFIGVGEGLDDLQLFNKKEFVDSFFNKS